MAKVLDFQDMLPERCLGYRYLGALPGRKEAVRSMQRRVVSWESFGGRVVFDLFLMVARQKPHAAVKEAIFHSGSFPLTVLHTVSSGPRSGWSHWLVVKVAVPENDRVARHWRGLSNLTLTYSLIDPAVLSCSAVLPEAVVVPSPPDSHSPDWAFAQHACSLADLALYQPSQASVQALWEPVPHTMAAAVPVVPALVSAALSSCSLVVVFPVALAVLCQCRRHSSLAAQILRSRSPPPAD